MASVLENGFEFTSEGETAALVVERVVDVDLGVYM